MIINMCSNKLSELEFVKPIEDILKNYGIRFFMQHYLNITQKNLSKAEKIIICGTALRDLDYLRNTHRFSWLEKFEKPVLGICAGFRILARVFDNDLIEKTRIGQFKVYVIQENKLTSEKEFYSYFLSSKAVKIRKHFEILAKSGNLECMVKHENKEIYGCLFYPEVLNPAIIINFCNRT